MRLLWPAARIIATIRRSALSEAAESVVSASMSGGISLMRPLSLNPGAKSMPFNRCERRQITRESFRFLLELMLLSDALCSKFQHDSGRPTCQQSE
jgi:hypothetical protein